MCSGISLNEVSLSFEINDVRFLRNNYDLATMGFNIYN